MAFIHALEQDLQNALPQRSRPPKASWKVLASLMEALRCTYNGCPRQKDIQEQSRRVPVGDLMPYLGVALLH